MDKNLQDRKAELDWLMDRILSSAKDVVSKECYKKLKDMLKESKNEKS